MKRKRRTNLERSQDSVAYVPDAVLKNRTNISNRSEYLDKFYARMFIEDVKLGIMPFGGRTSKNQFLVSLEPSNSEAQQIVEAALSPGEYRNGLTSEVCDFVAQCAVELLLFDTSTYEIVYLSEEEAGKLVGFEFVRINPITLFRRGNVLRQVLPDELATKLGKPGYTEFKPERILVFKLPTNIQGKIGPLMKSLAVLSPPTMPDFFMNELASGSRDTPYDAKAHIHMHKVALANATKLFGWNARLMVLGESLEYYFVHRSLLFEQFKIELRETILETLNEGVNRAGGQLGFQAQIRVTGLPSMIDVSTAFDHLQKGDIPFVDILEPFRGY